MMKYISLDIETTGRAPGICQIIQLAMVADILGSEEPINELPTFFTNVTNSNYNFRHEDLPALFMNLGTMRNVMAGAGCININNLRQYITEFIDKHMHGQQQIIIIGKNTAAFDWRFLREEFSFDKYTNIRFIDPTVLFMSPADTRVIDTQELYNRAGILKKASHIALDDARCMIEIFRRGMAKLNNKL
jgi:DNA polymerase III alpha subunit (gram-positive type)